MGRRMASFVQSRKGMVMDEQITRDNAIGVLETVRQDVNALKNRDATDAEFRELLEKTREDATEALKVASRVDDVETRLADLGRTWQPGGPSGDRIVPEAHAGSLRSAQRYLSQLSAKDSDDLTRYHEVSDCVGIMGSWARTAGKLSEFRRSPLAQEFLATTARMAGRSTDAYDTTEDTNWTAVEYSTTLIDKVRDATMLARLFPVYPMMRDTVKLPALLSDMTVYKGSETTVPPEDSAYARYTAGKASDTVITLDAVKLIGRAVASTETFEEVTFEFAVFWRDHLIRKMADAQDDAIVNGDTAATHMDSNVTATGDRRKLWLGIRAHCIDQTYTTAGTTWADGSTSGAQTDLLIDSRKAMGKYGGTPFTEQRRGVVHAGSYSTFFTLMKDDDVKTYDKAAGGASILSGSAIRTPSGVPFIATEFMAENLAATGVYDGSTTTKTAVITFDTTAFILGVRRGITVKTDEIIESDQVQIVATWRGDFEPLYAIASHHICDMLIGITA